MHLFEIIRFIVFVQHKRLMFRIGKQLYWSHKLKNERGEDIFGLRCRKIFCTHKRDGTTNHVIHHFQTQIYSTICQDCKPLMSYEKQVMQATVGWIWQKQIKKCISWEREIFNAVMISHFRNFLSIMSFSLKRTTFENIVAVNGVFFVISIS